LLNLHAYFSNAPTVGNKNRSCSHKPHKHALALPDSPPPPPPSDWMNLGTACNATAHINCLCVWISHLLREQWFGCDYSFDVIIWWLHSDQRKVPALLYVGKNLSTGPSVIFNVFPGPTGLGHRSQITEGPVLRPFFYTKWLQNWDSMGMWQSYCDRTKSHSGVNTTDFRILSFCLLIINGRQILRVCDGYRFISVARNAWAGDLVSLCVMEDRSYAEQWMVEELLH
jgi:hypothetical protein